MLRNVASTSGLLLKRSRAAESGLRLIASISQSTYQGKAAIAHIANPAYTLYNQAPRNWLRVLQRKSSRRQCKSKYRRCAEKSSYFLLGIIYSATLSVVDDALLNDLIAGILADLEAGLTNQNWDQAFAAWHKLYFHGEDARLDDKLSVRLLSLLRTAPRSKIAEDWTLISEHLLLSLARRGMHELVWDILAGLLFPVLQREDLDWARRTQQLWRAYISGREADDPKVQPILPDLSCRLFAAVILAYCQDPSPATTLLAFFRSFRNTPMPRNYTPERTARYLRATKTCDRLHQLPVWLRQCDLFEAIQPPNQHLTYQDRQSRLIYANERWRDTQNPVAVTKYWQLLTEALSESNPGLRWWTVLWREEQGATSLEDVFELYRPQWRSECTNNVIDDPEDKRYSGRCEIMTIKNWGLKTPEQSALQNMKLPALFIPPVAVAFYWSFITTGQPLQAAKVCQFCQQDLSLTPTFGMWLGRLRALASAGACAEAEEVFRQIHVDHNYPHNIQAWAALIRSYWMSNRMEEGERRVQDFLTVYLGQDQRILGGSPMPLLNRALQALYRCRPATRGKARFLELLSSSAAPIQADIGTFNSALYYYARPSTLDLTEIARLTAAARERRLQPNATTFANILSAFVRAGRPDAVAALHKEMMLWQVEPDLPT